MADIPPVMTNPHLLPSGEAWTQLCGIRMHGTDRAGRQLTLTCGIKTQGGAQGLLAHIRTVHAEG